MENLPVSFIEQDIVESKARDQEIVTRFPPEPNGYMHIGHAKAFGLDYFLAKKYGGYTNLRFDDTNPAKENMKYVESMMHDIKWLGMDWKNLLFASDYYEQLYDFAVVLIKKGLAYVDDQTAEQISENRGTLNQGGKESHWRGRAVSENLELFKKMREGAYPDGAKVLRAKIDMGSSNINMRDPVMYRIARVAHYRTGNSWCIYPLYDFAHPLSDLIEGISHSICSFEYEDHRPLYDWFVANVYEDYAKQTGKQLSVPRQFEFSRLNIEQFVMSKRWLKKFVDEGMVDGWDDPRMPTISGMRRRGYPPKAIMDFVLSTGVSKSQMCVPMSALEYHVRAELDPSVTRVAAVTQPIRVLITNYDGGVKEFEIANNPHDESAGKHGIHFGKEIYIDGEDFSLSPPPKWKRLTEGGTVRLRGAYIIRCDKVVFKGSTGEIDCLQCSITEDKPSGVIQFVEKTTAVPVTVYELRPLLKSGTELADENINTDTRTEKQMFCEKYIEIAKTGDVFQFVRKGFFAADTAYGKLVFNKTVGLKEGY